MWSKVSVFWRITGAAWMAWLSFGVAFDSLPTLDEVVRWIAIGMAVTWSCVVFALVARWIAAEADKHGRHGDGT